MSSPALFVCASLLLATGLHCGGNSNKDAGPNDAGGTLQRDLSLQPGLREAPYANALHAAASGIYLRGNGLWHSSDEGDNWELIFNRSVGGVAETSDGRLWVKRNVGTQGERVSLIENGQATDFDAPWEASIMGSVLIITASDNTLWLEVTGRVDDLTLAPAEFWRLVNGQWERVIAPPTESKLWVTAATPDGGLVIYDGYSLEPPYAAYRYGSDEAWHALGAWPQVGGALVTQANTVLLQVREQAEGPWSDVRITEAGTTTTTLLSSSKTRAQRADGTLVRLRNFGGSDMEESIDDGLTWSAPVQVAPTRGSVIDFVPISSGLLGMESLFLTRMRYSDPRWVIEGIPRGAGYEVGDVASAGSRLIAGLTNTNSGMGLTRIMISEDDGNSWTPGPAVQSRANTICGSDQGWLVVGGSSSMGNTYSFLSADGREILKNDRIDIPDILSSQYGEYYTQFGLEDLAFNRLDSIDCAFHHEFVALSIADLERDDGLLLMTSIEQAVDEEFLGDSWDVLLMPLDMGDEWPAPAALILGDTYLPAATFRSGTISAGGLRHTPFYVFHSTSGAQRGDWASPERIYPGPITPIAQAVAGGTGMWLYEDGTMTDGVNALVRSDLPGFPRGQLLLGAAGSSDGHLWVATSFGLYRTVNVPSATSL